MLRVLHVIGKMDRAGAETIIMNVYRHIDRTCLQFDFMVFGDARGDYDDEIEAMGGHIYHMPAFCGYNYIKLWRMFRDFFGEHSYKVVHGHIASLAPAYLYWAKKKGAFTIAHSHSTDNGNWFVKWAYRLLTRGVIYIADYFMACSLQAGINRFGKRITNQENFAVVKNAISAGEFVFSYDRHTMMKEQYGLNEKLVIGHVGRFTEAKNHFFLLEIFEKIKKLRENAVLVLVGRGELEDKIKEKIKRMGLEDDVLFMGVRENIADFMNLYDVFVFPSIYEGLGIVGIEAQAAGLPCFFSDAIPEEAVVTNHVWKLPLSWGAEKWAVEMLKITENFKRENDYGSIVSAGYDIAQVSQELEKFYLQYGIN